jgi:hypothetical protein
MENYLTPQKPKELNFSDNKTDTKITSMDYLIAEKMAERNQEIELLYNSNYNTTINKNNWLTPKETSLKNDKQFINDNNNITLSINENPIKKVSWNFEKETTTNIFDKLKKQPVKNNIIQINNLNTNTDTDIDINQRTIQYVEQKSIQLPNIEQEEITINQPIQIPANNEPIIPKTEIIKQLNEMNKKIDNLYDIVLKLTNLINVNKENIKHSDVI